jgi:hypothetical protein
MSKALRLFLFAITIAAAIYAPATAKILKMAIPGCQTNQICFYWWPQLTTISGWHTDENANYRNGENGVNTLVPDGFTFASADAVIYAEAIYKPRYEHDNPGSKTLDAFIADDSATFSARHKDEIAIAKADPLSTGDGQILRSMTYFQQKNKNWERVSYGEEGDYYILFVISARSLSSYQVAQSTYEHLIETYKQ